MSNTDWAHIHAHPKFKELHRRKSRFLWTLMAISVVYYFLLPVGAGYFPELFKHRLWGPLNFGLVFAFSEFLVAWGIAAIYARHANRSFDALAAELQKQFEGSTP